MNSSNLHSNTKKRRSTSPKRRWLTHKYGKTTFWSRWGIWIALATFISLFPIFAAGKIRPSQLPSWQRDYLLNVGPFIFRVVLLAIGVGFAYGLLFLIRCTRITLTELIILMLQTSGLTMLVFEIGLLKHLPQPPSIQYGFLAVCQFIYVIGGARAIHWATQRGPIRHWKCRNQEEEIKTAPIHILLFPLMLMPVIITMLCFTPIIYVYLPFVLIPAAMFYAVFNGRFKEKRIRQRNRIEPG